MRRSRCVRRGLSSSTGAALGAASIAGRTDRSRTIQNKGGPDGPLFASEFGLLRRRPLLQDSVHARSTDPEARGNRGCPELLLFAQPAHFVRLDRRRATLVGALVLRLRAVDLLDAPDRFHLAFAAEIGF